MTVRVVLVDDHAMLRNSLAQLLNGAPGIDVVATFADGESAVAGIDECAADVVLMDVAMPGIGGIEATRQLVESTTNFMLAICVYLCFDFPF